MQQPEQNVSASASSEVAPLLNDKRPPSIAVVVPPPPRRKPSVVAQRQASECQNRQRGDDDGSRRSSRSSKLEPRVPQRRSKRRRIVTRSMRESSERALSPHSAGSPTRPTPSTPVLPRLSPAGHYSTRDIVGLSLLLTLMVRNRNIFSHSPQFCPVSSTHYHYNLLPPRSQPCLSAFRVHLLLATLGNL